MELFLREGKVFGSSWNWMQNGCQTAFLETHGAGYLVLVVSDWSPSTMSRSVFPEYLQTYSRHSRKNKDYGVLFVASTYITQKYSRSSARRHRTRQLNPLPGMGGHAALKCKVHIWSALNSPKWLFVQRYIVQSNLIYLGIGHCKCLLMSVYVAITKYCFKSLCPQSLHSP